MQQTTRETASQGVLGRIGWILQRFQSVSMLIALCIVLAIASPYFLTTDNLLNVLRQVSIVGIIAAGQTAVIITAGIDLSVGALLAMSAAIAAGLYRMQGIPAEITIPIGLLAGAFLGLLNGLMVTKLKLAPFIVTLGMMGIARGLVFVYTQGVSRPALAPIFKFIGQGYVLGIPVPVIVMAIVFLLMHIYLSQTKAGRYTYAIGDNEETCRLSGVNIDRYKTYVYVISGLLAGVAGIILVGRLRAAPPIAGIGDELDSIAAAVIGGTSLMGGQGTMLGTLVGALIMGLLRNGLNLLGVSSFWQQTVIGVVIILAVYLDSLRSRLART